MNENLILTYVVDTIDLTLFDYDNASADGWTVKMTKGEAAVLAAKLLQYAATED